MKKVVGAFLILLLTITPYLHLVYEIQRHMRIDIKKEVWKEGEVVINEFEHRDGWTETSEEYVSGHFETKHSSNRLAWILGAYSLFGLLFGIGVLKIAALFNLAEMDSLPEDFSIHRKSSYMNLYIRVLCATCILIFPLSLGIMIWGTMTDFI